MIKIPIGLRLLALVASLTGFYTFVGQMVPQKEVHPPRDTQIAEDVNTEEMVRVGQEIFEGKGICVTCHTIGNTSGVLRFPDLEGVGARAGSRIGGLDDVGYLAQTLYEPNAFIVDGFSPGMPVANKPPIGLTDDEILAVIAFLQSLGGEPTVTMATQLTADGSGAETAVVAAVAEFDDAPPPAATPHAAGGGADVGGADVGNGERLYGMTCVVCHGDRAQGNEALNAPRLAGQESWYIERQLKNFAAGARGTDPTDIFGMQMRPMAMTLNGDQEIADVAAFLSSLN